MSDNVNRFILIISCKINRYIFSLTLFNLGHKYLCNKSGRMANIDKVNRSQFKNLTTWS